MHAARIERHGPLELTWSEATLPAPGPDQVLIDVHTAGVNFPDVLVVQGTYQNLAPLPFSPGKEVAGVVRSAGARVVSCRPGDRVVALIENGGYAEQVLAPAANTYVLPAGIDFVTAATTMVYQTAHFALLERGAYRAGESVLVTGATGGVGMASVQLAKALGATVLAAIGTPAKIDFARSLGADAIIDASAADPSQSLREQVRAVTADRGADVIIENVGGALFEACLRALAWSGRIVVVGFAGGSLPVLRANYLLIKNITATGLHWSDYRDRDPALVRRVQEEIMELLRSRRLKPPIAAVYSMERAVEALRELAGRTVLGKLVLATEAGRRAGIRTVASN